LTLFSFIVADLIGFFIGEKLVVHSKIKDNSLASPSQIRKPFQQYSQAILEGNIFSRELRGKKDTEIASIPDNPPEIELTPLNIRLIGTVVGWDSAKSFAVIQDEKTKNQELYRINDMVVEGAKLVYVDREKATLLRGGREELLLLFEEELEEGSSQMENAKLEEGENTGIRTVAPNNWVLDKREVSQAFENLPQLLTKARIIPNFTQGKANGFRIISIVPNSIYERIGLKNGDILQRINGIDIKDPQSFLKIFQQLKDETSISLDLVRNNIKTSFDYEIR
jgi:general secretion pathway protein C